MGISLHLDILPHLIDPNEWAKAYDDSVALLRAWPGGMLRLAWRQVRGHRVLVYQSEIESGDGDRMWKVEGDRTTLRTGESHSMHRSLAHYHPVSAEHDIVVALARGGSTAVLCNKTQGEPYHLPLLAVAMLIEDRFPRAAAVGGDIDGRDAADSAAWIQSVTGRKVALPILLNADRLAERLRGTLAEKEVGEAMRRLHLAGESPFHHAAIADILGILKSRALLHDDDLRDLATQGRSDTLSQAQRDLVNGVIVAAATICREREDLARIGPDREAWLSALAAALGRLGRPITDTAWDRIEEAPQKVLELYLGLTAMSSPPLQIFHVQRALFENAELCRYAVTLAADEARVASERLRLERIA